MSPARKAAWQALTAWLTIGPVKARLGSPAKPFPPKYLGPRDRAQAKRLAEGCVKRWGSLEHILKGVANGKRPRPNALLAALFIGAYELLFEHRSGAHAAVNEAVDLARQSAGKGGASFANAVLRKIAKNRDPERWLQETDLATRYSLPPAFVQKKVQELGQTAAEELFALFSEAPHLGLRVQRLRIDPDSLCETLVAKGFSCRKGIHPGTLILPDPSHGAILETEEFKNGFFTIQDSAHVEIIDVLCPEPEERVLDLCSAPGTKATAMAEAMDDKGEVYCFDKNQNRLAGLENEVQRLGLKSIRLLRQVKEIESLNKERSMDRVLVDAPCSNSGVLQRRAEARWHFGQEKLREFVKVQRALILQGASYLKPGGILVYSTCSLEPEENEDLARNLDGLEGLRLLSTERLPPISQSRDGSGISVFRKQST
jgi:16S rRNA (cytosine967-C5)-methyltransferase